VRSILLEQPGVRQADASFPQGRAWVVYDPTKVTAEALAAAVSPYYPSRVLEDESAK